MKRNAPVGSSPRTIPDGFVPGSTVARAAGSDTLVRFVPTSWNASARTIEAVLSTGAPVTRWGITEQLEMSASAIDLARVALGQVKLLDSHDQSSIDAVLGTVESARMEGAALIGTIRFLDNERARAVAELVAAGDLGGISIGYRVNAWSMTAMDPVTGLETWTATRWELLEASLVSVPADPLARVRSLSSSPRAAAHEEGDAEMRRNLNTPAGGDPAATAQTVAAPVPAAPAASAAVVETRAAPPVPAVPAMPANVDEIIRAETTRVTEIQALARAAGLVNADGTFDPVVGESIAQRHSLDQFRARAFDVMATRATLTPTRAVQVIRDEGDTLRRDVSDAIYHGVRGDVRSAGDRVSDRARLMSSYTISELAAEFIGERRLPRGMAEHEEVMRRAFHSTSDFPILLANGLNRVLDAQYQAAPQTYRQLAAQMTFMDFRAHEVLRIGDFPMLQPVMENGEIKSGTLGEKKESVTVLSYGVQIPFSRQLLINDRLGGLNQMLASYGTTVALFEEITFYAMMTSASGAGPTLLEDGTAVFTSGHGNLKTGATGTIDTSKLSTGRTALRKMKRLDGNPMNLAPSIIVAGPDRETEIQQALVSVQATQGSNVNVFAGSLKPVISAQIGALPWYLFVDPNILPVFKWGYLDGFTGPRMRIDEPFGMQGLKVSLEHDWGCGAVDYRGAWQNSGA